MSKFNRDSDLYIWVFAFLMTVGLGGVLASVQGYLAPVQKAQVELEEKKFILSSALGADIVSGFTPDQITSTYNERVESIVVNDKGEVIEGLTAKDVVVGTEYKKPADDRKLPVYKIKKEGSDEVEYYVFPLYGKGLWDVIWGYVALQSDLSTIKGAVYDHAGETPGLGARIASLEIQQRYIGKTIFDKDGTFDPVVMEKGEGNNYDGQPHKVDGMSGATFTAKGLNKMYDTYFGLYLKYIKSQQG